MLLQKIRVLVAMFLFAFVLAAQTADPSDHPVESEHATGPHGLEGWTLNWPLPENQNPGESFAFTLVIARNGKVLRKIDGDALIWNWMFWNDGRQIAYESGPLHFGLWCNLYDLRSGRVLKSIDCFHGIPENAPAWLLALEASR